MLRNDRDFRYRKSVRNTRFEDFRRAGVPVDFDERGLVFRVRQLWNIGRTC